MAVKETDRRTIVDRSGVSKRVRIGKVEWPPRQEEVVKPEVEVGRLLISEQKEKGGLAVTSYGVTFERKSSCITSTTLEPTSVTFGRFPFELEQLLCNSLLHDCFRSGLDTRGFRACATAN